MKRLILFAIIMFIVSTNINGATIRTNGTGGGNWSSTSTWNGGVIPGSSDIAILEDGDSLFVDVDVTVVDFRYEYRDQPSKLQVNSGFTLTITGDFIVDEPSSSDALANVIIEGTLDVGDDFRIFLSNNEDNLTVNIVVSGLLDVADNFNHASGLNSSGNVIRLTVTSTGQFDANTLTSTFSAGDSKFNIVNDGDINITSNISITTNGAGSQINFTSSSGSDFDSFGQVQFWIKDESSSINMDIGDNFSCLRFKSFSELNDDSLNLIVRNGATFLATTYHQIRNLASTNGYNKIEVENGGAITSNNQYILIQSNQDGIYDFDINGDITANQVINIDLGNGSSGTFNIGSTGELTSASIDVDLSENGNLTFSNAGTITTTGNVDFTALEEDDITVNISGVTNISGRYFQSTNGDNSAVTTNVSGTLTIGELRMDVLTTAAIADNVMDLDNLNSILSCTSINMDQGNKDATISSGTTNNSTIVLRGTTTTDLPIRSSIDFDNITISNTSAAGVTLDEGDLDNDNFNGDLTITAGATFDLNGINSVYVQGNFVNAGTYQDNGQNLTVDGNFTNTFEVNNGGSNFTIGGNFINSGTFNTLSASTSMDVTGSFTNSGTFDAEITTLDVDGDFSNTSNYTSAGSGNDIIVAGDWNNTGNYTFISGDVVTLNGSSGFQDLTGNVTFYDLTINHNGSGVRITGGNDSIQHALDINSGTLTTNGNLTFLSNSINTAMLTNMTGGGTISGNVTVERYLDEGNGWYLLGSPVTGSTLADWNNELPMSGFTGSDEAANPWTSVYRYDEATRPFSNVTIGISDSGYVEASNTTNTLTPGQGWFVYIQNVKAANKAKTMNSVGPLKTGAQNISIKYSSYHFQNAQNGWNLIANPYASPVDWSLVSKATASVTGQGTVSTVQNSSACYRLDFNGNYQTVANSAGNRIYAHEAVWVQAAGNVFVDPSQNTTRTFTNAITFNENDKVINDDNYNLRTGPSNSTTVSPLQMVLTYSGSSTYNDSSLIKFETNATVHYDMNHDARKIANAYGNFPNIASTTSGDTTNENLIWNTLPDTDTNITIPINVWKRFPSNKVESFTIQFHGIAEWAKNNRCLILNDTLNQVTNKLDANYADYSWSMPDNLHKPVLFIDYSTPLDFTFDNATCFGYNDGQASVQGFGSGTHDYIWVDANNSIIKTEKDITGPSTMNTLSPGEYVIYVSDNGVCGEVATTISITEPDPIIAEFDSDVDSVWMNANTTIYFSNGSINADDYHWDFGDGNTSDQENPAHTYTAGGTYTVKLVGITGPCSDTLTKTVVVFDNVGINDVLAQYRDPINIYQYNNETFVDLNFNEATDATISMFDVLGRNIIEPMKLMNVTSRKERLDVPGNIMGVYTISVIAGDKKEAKRIYYTRR